MYEQGDLVELESGERLTVLEMIDNKTVTLCYQLPADFVCNKAMRQLSMKETAMTIHASHVRLVRRNVIFKKSNEKSVEGAQCKICAEGTLTEKKEYEETTYKGVTGLTPLYTAECSVCGVQATSAHMRANKEAMLSFISQVDKGIKVCAVVKY